MCSIMGYIGDSITVEEFKKGFSKTISRGPDMSEIFREDNVILGFHRLAIMGLNPKGMQPFYYNDNVVVCNGELYGFRTLKNALISKGYQFESESDCELLLPLYNEHGLDMFNMLDAEFALIIYDKSSHSLIAARDPIGIRPLYYGYDEAGKIIFASEAKNLVGLCNIIMPFPPGHYYAEGKFVMYRDITKVNKFTTESIEEVCKKIKQKLDAGIIKRLDADAPLGFLLSGGLDSSLVCAVAAKHLNKPIETFAIGMKSDAIDLKYAKEAASYIKSNHHEIIITEKDVIDFLPEVVHILGTYDITTIRASMGMYLICRAIHQQTNIRVLLTGEISDELFGYKYTDYAPSPEEFQKEATKRIQEIHMYDVLRADRCISSNSLEARVPFGDLDFVSYVMSIAPEIKMNTYGIGKYLLRKAYEGDYLPKSLLMREKAAFSDAVGHSLVDHIKAYAEEKYSDIEFTERVKKYDFARPFTKESLLYRELFEDFYPNQAEMVKDFWMPNKAWAGCNVNDPSARVLSNYGKSGV